MAKVINPLGGAGSGGYYPSLWIHNDSLTASATATLTGQGKTYNGVFAHRQIPRLPSEYQEVEYIESTGTQYIDTGVPTANGTKIEIDLSPTSNDGQYYGTYYNSYPKKGGWFGYQSSESKFYGNTYNKAYVYALQLNQRYSIVTNYSGDLYVDNVLVKTFESVAPERTTNILLFAGNNMQVTGRNCGSVKIYKTKIYQDGFLIRDFVPCYEKASSTNAGMYDLLSNTFYPNIGTGTFTNGADHDTMVDDYGFLVSKIKEYGTYTWTVINGSDTKQGTIDIIEPIEYDAKVSFRPITFFTYTGTWQWRDYTTNAECEEEANFSTLALLSSGDITFEKSFSADVFLVGGGGGGARSGNGQATTAFGETANGGYQGMASGLNYIDGGAGGSGGGAASHGSGEWGSANGGSNGGGGGTVYDDNYTGYGGSGQGTTTKAFAEPNGYIYAGGGAGDNYYGAVSSVGGINGGGDSSNPAVANTGGGGNRGGGSGYTKTSSNVSISATTYSIVVGAGGGNGASGIVLIRLRT